MLRTPSGCEQHGQAGDEVVEVGDVGEDVVGRRGGRPRAPARPGRRLSARPKKRDSVGTPRAMATSATFRGRLDPEDGDAGGDEVLQEVAVVAGHLHDQAVGAEAEARHAARRTGGHARPSCRSRTRSRRSRRTARPVTLRPPTGRAGSASQTRAWSGYRGSRPRRAARAGRRRWQSGMVPRSTKVLVTWGAAQPAGDRRCHGSGRLGRPSSVDGAQGTDVVAGACGSRVRGRAHCGRKRAGTLFTRDLPRRRTAWAGVGFQASSRRWRGTMVVSRRARRSPGPTTGRRRPGTPWGRR